MAKKRSSLKNIETRKTEDALDTLESDVNDYSGHKSQFVLSKSLLKDQEEIRREKETSLNLYDQDEQLSFINQDLNTSPN